MIIKYFYYVKSRKFTHALALCSLKFRYKTPKRQWMAMRLGLYQTVLAQIDPAITKRQTVVKLIVSIKRNAQTKSKIASELNQILSDNSYKNFHKEIVQEVVFYYPNCVLRWLSLNNDLLIDKFYLGVYLGLLSNNSPFNAKQCVSSPFTRTQLEQYSDINLTCLSSNLFYNNVKDRLSILNKQLAAYSLSPIAFKNEYKDFDINNLKAQIADKELTDIKNNHKLPKVSVVITAFNAEETLLGCVESLIYQTWSNLEIIIVNDASTDSTWNIAQELKNTHKDRDIKTINLPKNIGTFGAKSIGALYAKGEYLTCQDSDDWAHPQKIYEQAIPLMSDKSLIATNSFWLRMTTSGSYHARNVYPFLKQNPASPMFRLDRVRKDIGLWHIVRTGADSEFFERLKLYYGSHKVKLIKKPLTIASHRENSLMTSVKYGAYEQESMLKRLDYWEAWRTWHIECLHEKKPINMPDIYQQAMNSKEVFNNTPELLKVSYSNLKTDMDEHIVC